LTARLYERMMITLVTVVLGFMLAMQYQTAHARAAVKTVALKSGELTRIEAEIQAVKRENALLKEKLDSVNAEIQQREASISDRLGLGRELDQELSTDRILAGTTPVKGPGITFSVGDSTAPSGSPGAGQFMIVHDADVQQVVNLLFASGAEAVAVNGQRIIARTGIICIGPAIRVNHVNLVSPFVFQAIGNPDSMIRALEAPGGPVEMFRNRKLQVGMPVKADLLRLPAYGDNSF
jgi:uncharacterized protein YlxW (UPF0749 family)